MKLIMCPTAPFDFELSTTIFSDGDREIRTYYKGKYWQVVRIANELFLIVITSIGTVDKPRLVVEVREDTRLLGESLEKVRETVISLFNLNFNLERFYKEVSPDNIMSKLIRQLRGYKSPTTQTVFEALISSITEQQISLAAAFSIQKRMVRTFGDVIRINKSVYYAFPKPKTLASATIEQLRACGLNTRKAEYIRDIAALISDDKLNLEKFKSHENTNEIVDELCKLRGVGDWTAELTLIRGMHKLDVIPANDLGLKRTISHYYCNDKKISSKDVRTIAKKWGNWKGLAYFYLIMAERLAIEI
ncbi:MAG TPA: DNA-3-methyladenine glycosylase [Candidatus Acidoferrum sp.]|nr:DNA-3-methyladenine glycosylase [Candidatus Acidoferrum sp.]